MMQERPFGATQEPSGATTQDRPSRGPDDEGGER